MGITIFQKLKNYIITKILQKIEEIEKFLDDFPYDELNFVTMYKYWKEKKCQ